MRSAANSSNEYSPFKFSRLCKGNSSFSTIIYWQSVPNRGCQCLIVCVTMLKSKNNNKDPTWIVWILVNYQWQSCTTILWRMIWYQCMKSMIVVNLFFSALNSNAQILASLQVFLIDVSVHHWKYPWRSVTSTLQVFESNSRARLRPTQRYSCGF